MDKYIKEALSSYKDKIDSKKPTVLHLSAYKVEKPYGHETWLELNKFYAFKLIFIRAGGKSSLQKHNKKFESNYIVSGKAEVLLENENGIMESFIFGPGDGWTVHPGKKHRVIAIEDYTALEVSTPHLNDVIRFDDVYGRKKKGTIEGEHKS